MTLFIAVHKKTNFVWSPIFTPVVAIHTCFEIIWFEVKNVKAVRKSIEVVESASKFYNTPRELMTK